MIEGLIDRRHPLFALMLSFDNINYRVLFSALRVGADTQFGC
jgi:hypothetical protein